MNSPIDENNLGISAQGGDKTGVVETSLPSNSPALNDIPNEAPSEVGSDAVMTTSNAPIEGSSATPSISTVDDPTKEPKKFSYDEPLEFNPNDEKIQKFGKLINKNPEVTANYIKQNANDLGKMAEDLGFGREHVPEMVSVIRSYASRNVDFKRALEMDTQGFKYHFVKPAVDTASLIGSTDETRYGGKQFFDDSDAVKYTAFVGAGIVAGALGLGAATASTAIAFAAPVVAGVTAFSMAVVGALDLIYHGAKAVGNMWDRDVQNRPEGIFVQPQDNREFTDEMAGNIPPAIELLGAGIRGYKQSKKKNGNSSNTTYYDFQEPNYVQGIEDGRTYNYIEDGNPKRPTPSLPPSEFSGSSNVPRIGGGGGDIIPRIGGGGGGNSPMVTIINQLSNHQANLGAFWKSETKAYTKTNDIRDSDYYQELRDFQDLVEHHAIPPSRTAQFANYVDDVHNHYMIGYEKGKGKEIPRLETIKRPHPREGLNDVPDKELGENVIEPNSENVSAQNVIKGYLEHGRPVLQLANVNRQGGDAVYSPLRELDPEQMEIMPYSKSVDKEVKSNQPIGFGGHVLDNLAPWQAKRGVAIYPLYKNFQNNVDKVEEYMRHAVNQTKGSDDLNARFIDNTSTIKDSEGRAYVVPKDKNNHLSNALSNLLASKQADAPLIYMMNLNKVGDNDTGTLAQGNIGEVASSFVTRELANKGINPKDLIEGGFTFLDTNVEDLYNIKHMNQNSMLPVFDIFNNNDRFIVQSKKSDGTYVTGNLHDVFQFVSPFEMLAHDTDEPMVKEVYDNVQFKSMFGYLKGSFIEKDFRSAIVSMMNMKGQASTTKDKVGGSEVNFNIYSRFKTLMEAPIEDRISAGITGNYLIANVSEKLRRALVPNHDVVENPIFIDPTLTYIARKVTLPRVDEFNGKPFDEGSLTDEEWDKALANYLMNWLVMYVSTSPTHFGDSNYSNATGLSKDETSRPLSHVQFSGSKIGIKVHGLQSAGMMDMQIISKFIGDHKFLNSIITKSNGRYVVNTKKNKNEDLSVKQDEKSLTDNVEPNIDNSN